MQPTSHHCNPRPQVTINLPDSKGRRDVLAVHTRRRVVDPAVDLDQLALDTPGLSGAELEALVNEAALAAAKRGASAVGQADIDAALDRLLFGLRQPRAPARMQSPVVFAVHEAGVAVVSEAIRAADAAWGIESRLEAVERASIVRRAITTSRTVLARCEDEVYFMPTRGRLRARLRVIMAGAAAESLLLGMWGAGGGSAPPAKAGRGGRGRRSHERERAG